MNAKRKNQSLFIYIYIIMLYYSIIHELLLVVLAFGPRRQERTLMCSKSCGSQPGSIFFIVGYRHTCSYQVYYWLRLVYCCWKSGLLVCRGYFSLITFT